MNGQLNKHDLVNPNVISLNCKLHITKRVLRLKLKTLRIC